MDYINSGMDYARGTEEFKLGISDRTEAAIIESILGLGYISTNRGEEELIDMPDIINLMETGLREFNAAIFRHKERGHHEAAVEAWDDYEMMGDTEECMEDWPQSPIPDYV
eukprot:16450488-Heterocapsa_arctica.AAC.2